MPPQSLLPLKRSKNRQEEGTGAHRTFARHTGVPPRAVLPHAPATQRPVISLNANGSLFAER